MLDFGFFTERGEQAARRLVVGLCRDVENDMSTRRQAMDRLADAMERIGTMDEGAADYDVLERVLRVANTSFAQAGFMPVSFSQYRAHASERQASNDHDVAESSMHLLAARAAEACGHVMSSIEALRACGVDISLSPCPPWSPSYDCGSGHVSVYVRPPSGEWAEEHWQVGVLVLGSEFSQHLDFLLATENPEAMLLLLMPSCPPEAYSHFRALGSRLFGLNVALATAPDQRQPAVLLHGTSLEFEWDGVPVSFQAGSGRKQAILARKGRPPVQAHVPLDDDAFLDFVPTDTACDEECASASPVFS